MHRIIVLLMSNLKNKSEILKESATLLHDKYLFPAVAYCSYYGCFQLLKHIWLHKMGKSNDELDIQRRRANEGLHDFLINQIVGHIKSSPKVSADIRIGNDIIQLKRLRSTSDYEDSGVDITASSNAIDLSDRIRKVLNGYI